MAKKPKELSPDWDFLHARRMPRHPEIDEHDLAFELGEVDLATVVGGELHAVERGELLRRLLPE